jgi:hypothetical protein
MFKINDENYLNNSLLRNLGTELKVADRNNTFCEKYIKEIMINLSVG